MGLAKQTAHATTATFGAIIDAQSEENLTGIPANYFENRAEQLEEAAEKLKDEKAEKIAELEAEKHARIAELKAEKARMLAQYDQELAQVRADTAQEEKQVAAELDEEREQLEEKAADFRHQAARYDTNKRRCSYFDCVRSKASVPNDRAGKLLFQALMIGGMVSIMASFNGYRHSGVEFFLNYHWMYPFIFCLTFLIRELFMNRVTDAIVKRWVVPNFEGPKRGLLITFINTSLMVPLMASIVTCILYGFDNLGQSLLEQVPITFAVALLVNYLFVGPLVKMFYNNVIVAGSDSETGAYGRFQQMIMPWLAAFNS